MDDLTVRDVEEIKRFLVRLADDIRRWLPAPLEPAWKSEASLELRNGEQGPNGPWGEEPVRMTYAARTHVPVRGDGVLGGARKRHCTRRKPSTFHMYLPALAHGGWRAGVVAA